MSARRRLSGEQPVVQVPPPGVAAPVSPIRVVEPRIDQYLEGLFPTVEPVLMEMEMIARREGYAIAGPLLGRLLRQLATAISARDVFEMGSGFGYSTLYLAYSVGDTGRVVHTERDPARSALARELLGRAGFADRVTFEVGEAVDIIANYPGPFDLIFIDVDRDKYPEALELARPRVRPGGYIVVDDVLLGGQVMDRSPQDRDTLAVQRYTREALLAPDLLTTILPMQDGVALHLKLPEGKRRR